MPFVLTGNVVSRIKRGAIYGQAGEEVEIISKEYGDQWIVQSNGEKFFAPADMVVWQEPKKKEEEKPKVPTIAVADLPKNVNTKIQAKPKKPLPPKQSSLF